jgi:hypothetical protein
MGSDTRVPTSSDEIHRFRPQAQAPAAAAFGVCLPHQRCGDGEVSGSDVGEGVCEAPTFMPWSGPQWWCRPTLKVSTTRPEGVPALRPYHQAVRVGHCVGLSETQGTRCPRLHPIAFV